MRIKYFRFTVKQIITVLLRTTIRRKLYLIVFLVLLMSPGIIYLIDVSNIFSYGPWSLSCFQDLEGRNKVMELEENEVEINKSVWFIVTGCLTENTPLLTRRQACSLESAARLNPNRHLYLLSPSPLRSLTNQPLISLLSNYSNIRIRHLNLGNLFNGTPLQEKWEGEQMGLPKSLWPMVHASDIFRFTLLWKFGGVYSDLDVLFFKPFEEEGFVSAESDEKLGSSVLSLPQRSLAIELSVLSLRDDYRPWHWSYNGPDLVTRIFKTLCSASEVAETIGKTCYGIHILPHTSYFPISWNGFKRFFTEDFQEYDALRYEMRESHGVHLWNSQTRKIVIEKGSTKPLEQLMALTCPNVFNSIHYGEEF